MVYIVNPLFSLYNCIDIEIFVHVFIDMNCIFKQSLLHLFQWIEAILIKCFVCVSFGSCFVVFIVQYLFGMGTMPPPPVRSIVFGTNPGWEFIPPKVAVLVITCMANFQSQTKFLEL